MSQVMISVDKHAWLIMHPKSRCKLLYTA